MFGRLWQTRCVGIAIPFVTIERESGTVVGSTRFGNIDTANRKAEIGWTWINPDGSEPLLIPRQNF